MTPAITLSVLDCMSQGVSVVERFAKPLFGEIFRHDRGLHLNRPLHYVGREIAREVQTLVYGGVEIVEYRWVSDEAGLRNFGKTGSDLCFREAREQFGIDQDSGGCVK
ncbi:unannotated protein [freshwater metagenome]|uniref:Unannotated protein n=1 Tax=freshwater metagenome TaxID=449393 RepID=A0A6J7DPD4_9ZZZZ